MQQNEHVCDSNPCVGEGLQEATSGCTHPTHYRDDVLTLDTCNRLALSKYKLERTGTCDLQLAKYICSKGRSIRRLFASCQLVFPRDFGRDIEHPDMGFIADPTWGIYPQKHRVKGTAASTEHAIHAPSGSAASHNATPLSTPSKTPIVEEKTTRVGDDVTNNLQDAPDAQQRLLSRQYRDLLSTCEIKKRLDVKKAVLAAVTALETGVEPQPAAKPAPRSTLIKNIRSLGFRKGLRRSALKQRRARSRGKLRRRQFELRGRNHRSARMAGSSADTASSKRCKPNSFKIGKLYPLVSEDGRLLERHNLPHQRLLKMLPNTLCPESEQTNVTEAARAVVKEVFDGANTVPDWLLDGFEPMDALYRGEAHYYVWYPLDLRERFDKDQDTSYRVYMALVNRIDAMERLIQHTQLPLDVRRALVMFQDMHHMLCLFMTVYAVFCDQELRQPAVFNTLTPVMDPMTWTIVKQQRRARALCRAKSDNTLDSDRIVKETVLARASVWEQYRVLGEDCERLDSVPEEMKEFRQDCKKLFGNRSGIYDGSFLDIFYPSYEFVFHEGELPDLSIIVRHAGLFGEDTLADIPFEDHDMMSLRNLLAKSLPLPMRPREIDAISAEKCEENELVNYCLQRMTFATLGGYYNQCKPTSFHVRGFLYRWFQFCPPYLDQFCSWLYGHKRLALDGETPIEVIHKELVLHIVKEYLVNMVFQMPDVSEHLTKYRWFGEMTFEMHEALENMRQTIDDVFYGTGERWLRFERRYFKYVSEYENQRISHNLKPRLGDFWNSRNKRVCSQKSAEEQQQEAYDQQQCSATITRDKLPRGNINVYPMRRKRKKPRVAKQHQFTEQLKSVYEQTLRDLPVERNSAYYSPDALFGPEDQVRDDGTSVFSECDANDLAQFAEEDEIGDIENKSVEDVYDMMMRKIERAKNKRSAAIKAASKSVHIQLVLSPALCNSILRIIMDPISDRACELPHLTKEHFRPLSELFQLSIEWFGRLGKENMTPLDLIWDVVQDKRRWDIIQYALDFKLQHRTAPFVTYDVKKESKREYRERWLDAANKLAEELTDKGLRLANDAINASSANPDDQVEKAYAQWDEKTRRRMIRQFLHIYTGNPKRPVNEDHRSVYGRLHGVSLIWNRKARCMCPQCMNTDEYTNDFLYREFQQTVCSQDAACIVFHAYTTTLCNAILRDVYDKKTIKYLYRTTSQPFVQHLVEQMWMASEAFKTNETFQKALAAIKDDELRFITAVVSRLPRWMPVSMEWLACPPLTLHWSPIAVLRWARVMYESNTYTIDLRSSVREMITVFPREFILIQHMFAELHARRSAILYKLPHDVAQQQLITACKKFNVDTSRGDLLPPIAYEYYYCPKHGDVKRPLARNDPRITMSYGHTGVAYNPKTGCVECALINQRSRAKAQGPIHRMRKYHAKLRYIQHVINVALQDKPQHAVLQKAASDRLMDVSEMTQRAGLQGDMSALASVEGWLAKCQHLMRHDTNEDIADTIVAMLESFEKSKHGKKIVQWLNNARNPAASVSHAKSNSRRKRRVEKADDDIDFTSAGQADSSKAMLRNMADLQCGGPLPKVNLLGRLFFLSGRLYMLCPHCLTLMLYTRDSFGEFGISCNLCMSTLKHMSPRNLNEYLRVVCYQCGDNAPLERPENTYMYVLLDDTEIGRRSERAVYLCRKHIKNSLAKTGEVMGITAARKYMKMQVKRVGIGKDPLNLDYILVDMAENNNIVKQRPRGQDSRGTTRQQRGFYVWSIKDRTPQYRVKSGNDIPTDVTQRAVEVNLDMAVTHGVESQQFDMDVLTTIQQRDLERNAATNQDERPEDHDCMEVEDMDRNSHHMQEDVEYEIVQREKPKRKTTTNKQVIDWATVSHSLWDVSMKTPGVGNFFTQLDRMERRKPPSQKPAPKRVAVRKYGKKKRTESVQKDNRESSGGDVHRLDE